MKQPNFKTPSLPRIDRRIVYFLLSILILLLISNMVILFARGYSFDFKEKRVSRTGIISVSSLPDQASVFLNDRLVTATNNNISNLVPGKYTIKVTKEGYSSWEKQVEVKEEQVVPVDIILFPSVPTLSPVTFTGINNPKNSPDQTKIVYSIRDGDKSGLWVLDLNDRPLIFSRAPKQIAKDDVTYNFSEADYAWAPDSKSVVVELKNKPSTLLLNADSLNRDPLNDITGTIAATRQIWTEEEQTKHTELTRRLTALGQEVASRSTKVVFSPDENRFLSYQDGGNGQTKVIVYDAKPSPDPGVKETTYELPRAKEYYWYSDSRHLLLLEEGSLSIIEKDGTNKATIYSGSFEPSFVFLGPNGDKILLAANFNSVQGDKANLYAISLR